MIKIYDFIKKITELFPSHIISDREMNKITQLVCRFPWEILENAISRAFTQISMQNNIEANSDTMEAFLLLIGGIAYNLSLPPIEQKIQHIAKSGNLSMPDWNSDDAKDFLSEYACNLAIRGESEKSIVLKLRIILSITQNCIAWDEWNEKVSLFIDRTSRDAA